MKRFQLQFRLFAAILLTLASWQGVAAQPAPIMPGDINFDRVIDVGDVNVIIDKILGRLDLEAKAFDNADLTHDGIIDVSDANALIDLILGKGYVHADPRTLVVALRDGSVHSFPLSDKPEVSFVDDEMLVKSETETSYFGRNQLYQVYYNLDASSAPRHSRLKEPVADNPNQFAVYIYRNDDRFEGHLNVDIESIRFSAVGTDSVWYDNAVVQEVWTPDTVYRTPIAVVDSLTFQAPKPVLREGLFHITNEHVPYTLGVTDSTIVFNKSMPARLWPAVGQTVMVDVDASPYVKGACVIVDSVSTTGNKTTLHCYEAYLGDVFEKLVLVGKMYTTDDTPAAAPGKVRRRSFIGDWWDENSSTIVGEPVPFTMPDISLKAGTIISVKSKKPQGVINYAMNITPITYDIDVDVFINHTLDANIVFSLSSYVQDYNQLVKQQEEMECFGEEWYALADAEAKEKNKGKKWYDKVFTYEVIPGFIDLFACLDHGFSGELALESGMEGAHADQKMAFSIHGLRPGPQMMVNPSLFIPLVVYHTDNSYFRITDYGDYHASVYAKGSYKFGIKGGLILKLFSERLVAANATASAGLKFSGQIDMSLDEFSKTSEFSWYEALKDSKMNVDAYADFSVGANVLKLKNLSVNTSLASKTWPLLEFKAFPELTQPRMPVYDHANGQWSSPEPFSFVMNPDNNVLLGMPVGLKLLDSNNNVLAEAKSTEKYRLHKNWKESYLSLPLLASYAPGTKLRVRPVVYQNYFGKEHTYDATSQDLDFTVPEPMALATNRVVVKKGKSADVTINGGWGEYSVTILNKDACTAEIKKKSYILPEDGVAPDEPPYIHIVGKTEGQSSIVTVKDLRTEETKQLLVTVGENGTGDNIVIERKYWIKHGNNYSYSNITLNFDNNTTLTAGYYNSDYWGSYSNSIKGIHIISAANGWYHDAQYRTKDWYIAPTVLEEWVKEKIIIGIPDGRVDYYMNDQYMGSEIFDKLDLTNAHSVTVEINPWGWWYTHYHYMDDFIIKTPVITIRDNFDDGVLDESIWKTPSNPDGVREEDGIIKTEQLRTDQDFNLFSKPIPISF